MEGLRALRNGSRSAFGIMATGRLQNGIGADAAEDVASAGALWSRCEAALAESRITVAASDREGRYTWIFNPPADLATDVVGRSDREVLPPDAAEMLCGGKA